MRALRVLFQLLFLSSAVYLGVGFARGWTVSSVERYCPLGGLATSFSLFSEQHLSCATGVFNVTLLVALLLLTVVARKAFCSWICPFGTISEWMGSIGGSISKGLSKRAPRPEGHKTKAGQEPGPGRRRRAAHSGLFAPPRAVDRAFRWLRLPVLALVLGFSFATAELIFRPYCPYYVTFGMNGHDTRLWSYALLGGLLLLAVAIPMAWCRYLCPLGGALWPFSAVGRLRLRRKPSTCTSCGACDRACPHSLPISTVAQVTSGECTLCLKCTRACPTKRQSLTLHASNSSKHPIHPAIVPVVVVAAIFLGVLAGNLLVIPSYSQAFADAASAVDADRQVTTLEVVGVRCVDTARRASNQLEGASGVLHVTAYASERQLVIEYDAQTVDVDGLVRAIEAPVYDAERRQFFFHVFDVVAIDGRSVD